MGWGKVDALYFFTKILGRQPNPCTAPCDEHPVYIHAWPDREKPFPSNKEGPVLPLGTYRQQPRKYAFFQPPASELTTLASGDGGDTWHLATSKDF